MRAVGLVWFPDHVLLHRRQGDDSWALPGGRVELGEAANHAIQREFNEELGISVQCGELLCVGKNFFEYQGKPHHEIGMYFSVQLPQTPSLLKLDATYRGVESNQRLEFNWFRRSTLVQLNLRPLVLRAMLIRGATLQRHFVQRDNKMNRL